MGQQLPEMSKPRDWMWKDDRFDKTEKTGGDRNSKAVDMKESVNKASQGKVSRVVPHVAVGSLAETAGWKGPTSQGDPENHPIPKMGQCAPA